MRPVRLLIVIPAKNEEKYLHLTLKSLISNIDEALRSLSLDVNVVVVNDGSTDNTPRIAREYSRRRHYIHVLDLPDKGHYDSSIGLVRAVRAGVRYAEIRGVNWDALMQVDADTILLNGYIAKTVKVLMSRDYAGIVGGITINEGQSPLHVRNTGILIRREVWSRCGGYKPFPSPDTIIQLCAIRNNWKIIIVKDAKMVLLRPTRLNFYRSGFVDGVTATSLPFTLGKALRIAIKSGIRESLNYLAGYLRGRLERQQYPEIKILNNSRRLLEIHTLKYYIKKYLR